MFNSMVAELTEGCLDFPDVKCGFIGEVGSVWPITGNIVNLSVSPACLK